MFLFCLEEREQVLLQKDVFQEEENMKSPAMYSPINDPIPNQYMNRLITQQYPSLPPIIEKILMYINHYLNDTYDPNYTKNNPNICTDNSRNESKYSVNKLKVNNKEDKDDEYKYENSATFKNYESVINKTEEEEAFI